MNTNATVMEQLAALATLGVATVVGSTNERVTSSWVLAGPYHRVSGVFIAGDIGSGASGVCSIRQASDSSGTGAKTLGTTATLGTDNTSARLDAEVSLMDHANGFKYVAVSVLGAVGNVPIGARLEGMPRYNP